MQRLTLGDVDVVRVIEWQGPFAPVDVLFPTFPASSWTENTSWLAPDFWDPATGHYQATMQSWVLRVAGRTVVIDTGMGNGKQRANEVMNGFDGDFLSRLAAVGVRPDDVDVVINTHLHTDHVGWNTRLVDGEWVPTFPRAEYLMNRTEFDYWNPANGHAMRSSIDTGGDVYASFADSVLPVARAGQVVLWEGDTHDVGDGLSLELAPGHTPGSAVLRLESHADRALFVGDLVHTPLQLLHPDHDTCLSEDQAEATRSRRRILDQAVATNSLVVPAHLGGAGAAEVAMEDGRYSIKQWAPWTTSAPRGPVDGEE